MLLIAGEESAKGTKVAIAKLYSLIDLGQVFTLYGDQIDCATKAQPHSNQNDHNPDETSLLTPSPMTVPQELVEFMG